MKPIGKLVGIVGNVVAAMDLVWVANQFIRLGRGENVLIGDAFEFFHRHPEHLPGIYVALAAAGIVLFFVSNVGWVIRYRRRRQEDRPECRFRAMTSELETELHVSSSYYVMSDPTLEPERYIERSTIFMELAELGICAPSPNSDNSTFVRFLTNIIPFARRGNLQAARELAGSQIGKEK